MWESADGRTWRCSNTDAALAAFLPQAVASSGTTDVAVGLTTAGHDANGSDGLSGAAWWRTSPARTSTTTQAASGPPRVLFQAGLLTAGPSSSGWCRNRVAVTATSSVERRLTLMDQETVGIERVEAAAVHSVVLADDALVDAWQAHRDEIYAFLVRTTRDQEVSQDLLQEAYLRLMRELRAGRGPDNVRAWLYRVAGNLAVSRGRRLASALRGLTRMRVATARDEPIDAPEDAYLRAERRSSVLARLATLDPDARAALLMASEGFSGAEIAAAIGRSELATRALLCRTRVKLRGDLDTVEAVG